MVGWTVAQERDQATLQTVVDTAPTARQYYSDDNATYAALMYYPGQHQALSNTSQTYAVEADNAELRHYLARLGRRSRCFSRSLDAVRQAIKVFVFAGNRRQLFPQAYPRYPTQVFQFLYP